MKILKPFPTNTLGTRSERGTLQMKDCQIPYIEGQVRFNEDNQSSVGIIFLKERWPQGLKIKSCLHFLKMKIYAPKVKFSEKYNLWSGFAMKETANANQLIYIVFVKF